jgi:hypothetical protein
MLDSRVMTSRSFLIGAGSLGRGLTSSLKANDSTAMAMDAGMVRFCEAWRCTL